MQLGKLLNKQPAKRLSTADSTLIDSSVLLGLEVEIENYTKALDASDDNYTYWVAHEDNSLRNSGIEFVFSEPLRGADVVEAVKFLCSQATKHRYMISERTGLHVHVDARSMEVEKFRNMNTLYSLLEKVIYTWVGDDRDRNIHCLPWYMADSDMENIGLIFKDKPVAAQQVVKNLHRYTGYNLASLGKFGTVEWRHLKTTFDHERIINWINIILAIKSAAERWEGSSEDLVRELKILGAYGFMNRVFGYKMTGALWYNNVPEDIREYGIPTATLFLDNSKMLTNLSDKDIREKFEKLATNLNEDEIGDNPLVVKWKASRGKAPAPRRVRKFTTSNIPMPELTPGGTMWVGLNSGMASQASPGPLQQILDENMPSPVDDSDDYEEEGDEA